jgi:MscS family membrane protein
MGFLDSVYLGILDVSTMWAVTHAITWISGVIMQAWWIELQERGIAYVGDNLWIVQVFTIIFLTLVVKFVAKRVMNKMQARLTLTPNIWDDALIIAARRPLNLLIVVEGLLWAVDIVYQVSKEPIFSFVTYAQAVSFIFFVSWFLIRLTKEVEHRAITQVSDEQPVDPTTAIAVSKLLRASVIITGSLVILQTLGFSISGVLAFGGVGGIAIGFAARDLLANFFGGLMIFLDRPFNVGDWILSPDKQIEGSVEHIGWRLTVIRKFDKRPLYVPNSFFSNIAVENPSRMTHRRIYETIGVRYSDVQRLPTIITDVKSMLMNHKDIAAEQTLIVNLIDFADSSVEFFIYCFTNTTDWVEFHGIKEDVMFKIADIIDAAGAEIAFPTQTLHVEQLNAMVEQSVPQKIVNPGN